MQRILFIHQSSEIGGGSYCLLNVIKAIDRRKFIPIVGLKVYGPLVEEIKKLNIEIIYFNKLESILYNEALLKPKNSLRYLHIMFSISAFKSMLKSNKIDIVYINNMMLYRYLKPAKESGCITILHVREHWPLNEHIIQLSWARKMVHRYCDQLIAINNYSASIFPEKDSTIVYDWIDMNSRFEYYPLSKVFGENMSDKRVYLFTGGIQPIKGALQVLRTFVSEIKDPSARLLCIGLNPIIETKSLRGQIKKNLASLGYYTYNWKVKKLMDSDSRIKNIPATYMITHIMQQCFCNLSYFTIPHANLAMAEAEILGLPTVAALNEEALEYSLNGKNAVLFEANNNSEFVRAIETMQINYQRYKDVLRDSHSVIAEMFSKQKNTLLLNQVISRVAQR